MPALVRAVVVVAALLAVAYVVDDLAIRYRLAQGDALGEVSLYYATRLKNRTIEIFYDRPVVETCVRALFPHLGHAPCWYLRRHTVKLVHTLPPIVPPWRSTSG